MADRTPLLDQLPASRSSPGRTSHRRIQSFSKKSGVTRTTSKLGLHVKTSQSNDSLYLTTAKTSTDDVSIQAGPNSPLSSVTSRPGNRKGLKQIEKLRSISRTPSFRRLLDQTGSPIVSLERRARLAAEHIRDAEFGLNPNLAPTEGDAWPLYLAHMIHRSSYFSYFVRCVILLHCSEIFMRSQSFNLRFGMVTACLLVYMVDVLAGVLDVGYQRYFNKWRIVYVAIILTLTTNLVYVLTSGDEHTTRVLEAARAILFLCRTATLHSITQTMARMLMQVLDTLTIAGVLIAVYSVIGIALFRTFYHDEHQNFHNFWWASLAMSVLLTTENFPDIFKPGFYNRPAAASIFFITYIAIGVWIYWSLLLAVIFNYYKTCHEEEAVGRRVTEQQSLLIAFSLMAENDETIDFPTFALTLKYLRPQMEMDRAVVMFKLLDTDNNGDIDLEEFLNLADILKFNIRPVPRVDVISIRQGVRGFADRVYNYFYYPHPTVLAFVSSTWFVRGTKLLVLSYAGAIMWWHIDISYEAAESIDYICLVLINLMVIETLLKIGAEGIREFLMSVYQVVDMVLVLINLLCLIILAPSREYVKDKHAICWIQIVRALLILRILTTWESPRNVIWALGKGRSTMMRLVGLLLVVFYVYGVIGERVFSGPVHPQHPDKNHEDPENFNAFSSSLLSLFQISTTNNWNDVMYSVIKSPSSSLYFVSFYFLVVMLLLNILTALILDTFTLFKDRSQAARDDVVYLSSRPVALKDDHNRHNEHKYDRIDENGEESVSSEPSSDVDEPNSATAVLGPVSRRQLQGDSDRPLRNVVVGDGVSVSRTYPTYKVTKTQRWSRSILSDRLPALKKREVDRLKNKVAQLEAKLAAAQEPTEGPGSD